MFGCSIICDEGIGVSVKSMRLKAWARLVLSGNLLRFIRDARRYQKLNTDPAARIRIRDMNPGYEDGPRKLR